MDLAELIVAFREDADDAGGFVLYDDPQLARWASEAETEAAIRAKLLYEDTDDITIVQVAANQAVVEIDPLLWRIDSASFTKAAGGRAIDLDLTGLDWIKEQCDWLNRASSRPEKIAHYQPELARIWPMPSVAGTLQLGGYRKPFNAMEEDDDAPEIPEHHHRNLVDWMLFRAYSKKDSEQNDPARAEDALARFTANFGVRDSADVMRRHRERRRCTVRMI